MTQNCLEINLNYQSHDIKNSHKSQSNKNETLNIT